MFENINLSSFFRKSENKALFNEIIEKTKFLNEDNPSIRHRLWHYQSNQKNKPVCYCGNLVKWSEKMQNYRTYCSQKCKANSIEWKNKIEITNMKRYGVKSTLSNPDTKEKIKNSLMLKFGVDNPFSSLEIQNKIKNTNLLNYGYTNPSKSQKIKNKITETHLSKYGFGRASQSHISDYIWNILNSKKLLKEKYLESFSGNDLAKDLGISPWLLFKQLHKLNIDLKPCVQSKEEKKIIELIKSIGVENIVIQDKSILFPQEIDIYLPDYQIGFEINGIYWHSESKGKNKYYHRNKSKKAYENGVKLIHFTDIDINQNFNKVENKIKTLLKLNKKIYARKCIIKNVELKDEISFLNNYHFQNYVPSKICLGLYYENELVSVMSFGKSRYNKKYDWELLRFCSKNNINIVGGGSKLFKYFAKTTKAVNCISYCDLSRSFFGSFYSKLGFYQINTAKLSFYPWRLYACG